MNWRELRIDAVLVERAAIHAGPDLAVDGQRVQIADAHFRLGLRDRGRDRASRRARGQPVVARNCRRSMAYLLPVACLIIPKMNPVASAPAARVFAHHQIADVAAQLVEFRAFVQRLVARIGERHVDDLADPRRPRGHDDDARGEIDRLLDRVRDQHHRLAFGGQHLQQQVLHGGARLRVERAERLVHQQELRLDRVGARERQPLAHAARQMLRPGVGEIGQAHQSM